MRTQNIQLLSRCLWAKTWPQSAHNTGHILEIYWIKTNKGISGRKEKIELHSAGFIVYCINCRRYLAWPSNLEMTSNLLPFVFMTRFFLCKVWLTHLKECASAGDHAFQCRKECQNKLWCTSNVWISLIVYMFWNNNFSDMIRNLWMMWTKEIHFKWRESLDLTGCSWKWAHCTVYCKWAAFSWSQHYLNYTTFNRLISKLRVNKVDWLIAFLINAILCKLDDLFKRSLNFQRKNVLLLWILLKWLYHFLFLIHNCCCYYLTFLAQLISVSLQTEVWWRWYRNNIFYYNTILSQLFQDRVLD